MSLVIAITLLASALAGVILGPATALASASALALGAVTSVGLPGATASAALPGATASVGLPGATATGAGHTLLVDALGDTLPAGPYPRRIISLSPNLTEVLFAAGIDTGRIAGVTSYCDYPPAAALRPRVGGIVDPSLERIEMQRPDIVLAARGNPIDTLDRIRALGIPVFAFDDRTDLEGIGRLVGELINLVGMDNPPRADSLRRRFDWELPAYRAWSELIPAPARPSVYYCDPEHPVWTAGRGSHVDDLIHLAGGRNVVDVDQAWPQYSAEKLLLAQPDWLLLALPKGSTREKALDVLLTSPGWKQLRAVREKRICWIDSETLLRPGPRILLALEAAAACLQPGRARPEPPASLFKP